MQLRQHVGPIPGQIRGYILLGLAAMLAGCAAGPPGPVRDVPPIEFNESVLASGSDRQPSACKFETTPPGVAFSDQRSILKFVLAHTPDTAVVYPTERYYYYKFPLGPRRVSGNIRFVDAEKGGISVGYFDAMNEGDMLYRQFFDGDQGVKVHYDPSTRHVDVAVDELKRTFVLDAEAFNPPPFPLLPDEQLVSGVRDESGYFLYLLYWPPGRDLYYVLNPSKPLPERLVRGSSSEVETWFGETSRFCFVKDANTGRMILVGVHRREIEHNTWFDGPFDQVPPNLEIRQILETAYPYVVDAGGIDAHGNFVKLEGQRVAISPYQQYDAGPDLETLLGRLVRKDVTTPAAWTAATYEYKKDWRAPQPSTGPVEPMPGGHSSALSVQWPANHWGRASAQWGENHRTDTSASWPPNHSIPVSGSKDKAGEGPPVGH